MDERSANHTSGPLRKANGFWFCETLHHEPFEMGLHSHDDAHIAFIIEGAAGTLVDHRATIALADTVAFMPPRVEHRTSYKTPVRAFYMAVPAKTIERLRPFSVNFTTNPFEICHLQVIELARHLRLEYGNPEPSSQLSLEGLMLHFWGLLSRTPVVAHDSIPPKWLQEMKSRLESEWWTPLSIQALAERAGVHPVYLMKTFRRHYGITIAAFVEQKRLDGAKLAIRRIGTEQSFGALALDLGYRDQSQFNRAFKRAFGLTPSQFRKCEGG